MLEGLLLKVNDGGFSQNGTTEVNIILSFLCQNSF